MSLLKGLNTVSVAVTDWAQAKAFYHDTLGLPILFDIEEVGWCEFGEAGKTTFAISLWRDATPPVRGGTIPVFNVDDCVQAVAELRKRGVKGADPVTSPAWSSTPMCTIPKATSSRSRSRRRRPAPEHQQLNTVVAGRRRRQVSVRLFMFD